MCSRFCCLVVGVLSLAFLALATPAVAAELSLSSPVIKPGTSIDSKFTCDGAGISPTLMIQNVPAAARSLVVEITDPDAPNGTFLHWGLYNLAPDTAFLAAGAASHDLPGPASSLTNDDGKPGYGAICPPRGQTHRYRFKLYALDARLSAQPANRSDLAADMKGHIIDQTQFIAHAARHD